MTIGCKNKRICTFCYLYALRCNLDFLFCLHNFKCNCLWTCISSIDSTNRCCSLSDRYTLSWNRIINILYKLICAICDCKFRYDHLSGIFYRSNRSNCCLAQMSHNCNLKGSCSCQIIVTLRCCNCNNCCSDTIDLKLAIFCYWYNSFFIRW